MWRGHGGKFPIRLSHNFPKGFLGWDKWDELAIVSVFILWQTQAWSLLTDYGGPSSNKVNGMH